MATTEDIQKTIIPEVGKSVDKVINRFNPISKDARILQRVTDPLDTHILQKLNTFTWDYMHTGQKINLANHLFEKAKSKNPNIPDEVLQKEISSFINNSFGGLDWLEVASQVDNKYMQAFAMKAANIRGRAWGQVLLFAPDWTVSTIRAFTTAIPKEIFKPKNWTLRDGIKGVFNPKTQGDFARKYVLHTAIAYLTILNAINMMMSHHPIWQNEDPTRIDLGDGTTMQPAKHSMEAAEWLRDPEKTLGNKLGFIPKAASVSFTGVQYPSPKAPKIRDNTFLGRAKAVGKLAIPFQFSAAIEAPEGKKLERAVMSTLGMPTYGMTREERAQAIRAGKRAGKSPEALAIKREKKLEALRKKWEQ